MSASTAISWKLHAMPVVTGVKTDAERFAGALKDYAWKDDAGQ